MHVDTVHVGVTVHVLYASTLAKKQRCRDGGKNIPNFPIALTENVAKHLPTFIGANLDTRYLIVRYKRKWPLSFS